MASSWLLGGPQERAGTTPLGAGLQRVRAVVRETGEYYADRHARRLLAVTSLLLTYGGGVVMFWFHAIYRGEQGPAINDVSHWFLDSTLGFIALTPVIVFLIPAAERVALATGSRYRRVVFYAVLVGASFALVTGPGPALHNLVAGEGQPLANWATDVFGHDPGVAERALTAEHRSHLTEGLLQVALGIPVYIGLSWLATHLSAATRKLNPAD